MRHFPTTEKHGKLYFTPLLKEFNGMVLFYLKVMLVNVGMKLEFLDLDMNLLLAGFLLLLGFGVLELAEIHDFTDRGRCGRRHLHQIQSGRAGAVACLEERHDAQGFVVLVNKANLFAAQVPVVRKYYACDGCTLLLGAAQELPAPHPSNPKLLLSDERKLNGEM